MFHTQLNSVVLPHDFRYLLGYHPLIHTFYRRFWPGSIIIMTRTETTRGETLINDVCYFEMLPPIPPLPLFPTRGAVTQCHWWMTDEEFQCDQSDMVGYEDSSCEFYEMCFLPDTWAKRANEIHVRSFSLVIPYFTIN